jgi:hypothetical protein
MDDPDDGFEKLLPKCRFAVGMCVWALATTLKRADRIRAHQAWAGILVGPATHFVVIGSCFASVLWLRHQ